MINPGDTIQTKKYATGDRPGALIHVIEVQESLVPELTEITGHRVKKDGTKGKQIIRLKQEEL